MYYCELSYFKYKLDFRSLSISQPLLFIIININILRKVQYKKLLYYLRSDIKKNPQ
jgi:hypothetical protein